MARDQIPSVLREILTVKAAEAAERAAGTPLPELSARVRDLPPCRPFTEALRQTMADGRPAVIAEIKRASPSAGLIRADFNPAAIARQYQAGGAACLSVLTDRQFFSGHEDYLQHARAACRLPVLRKDFIVDAWQVYETRVLGADAMLLIVAALGDAALAELSTLGHELGLAVLVEVHNREELERALVIPGRLLGINNRDLHRFETRLETSLELARILHQRPTAPARGHALSDFRSVEMLDVLSNTPVRSSVTKAAHDAPSNQLSTVTGAISGLASEVPGERIVVAESGIHTPDDIARLRAAGINAFLIGESLMRASDPGAALRELTTDH